MLFVFGRCQLKNVVKIEISVENRQVTAKRGRFVSGIHKKE
jgi:hypothetical protein